MCCWKSWDLVLARGGGLTKPQLFFKTHRCRAPLRFPVHLYRRRLHCRRLHPHDPPLHLHHLLLLLLLRGIQGIQGIHVEYRRPTTKWYQPGWSVQPGESTRVNKAATFRGGERENRATIQWLLQIAWGPKSVSQTNNKSWHLNSLTVDKWLKFSTQVGLLILKVFKICLYNKVQQISSFWRLEFLRSSLRHGKWQAILTQR